MPQIAHSRAYTPRELHFELAQRISALDQIPLHQLREEAQQILRRVLALQMASIEAIERLDRERRP